MDRKSNRRLPAVLDRPSGTRGCPRFPRRSSPRIQGPDSKRTRGPSINSRACCINIPWVTIAGASLLLEVS